MSSLPDDAALLLHRTPQPANQDRLEALCFAARRSIFNIDAIALEDEDSPSHDPLGHSSVIPSKTAFILLEEPGDCFTLSRLVSTRRQQTHRLSSRPISSSFRSPPVIELHTPPPKIIREVGFPSGFIRRVIQRIAESLLLLHAIRQPYSSLSPHSIVITRHGDVRLRPLQFLHPKSFHRAASMNPDGSVLLLNKSNLNNSQYHHPPPHRNEADEKREKEEIQRLMQEAEWLHEHVDHLIHGPSNTTPSKEQQKQKQSPKKKKKRSSQSAPTLAEEQFEAEQEQLLFQRHQIPDSPEDDSQDNSTLVLPKHIRRMYMSPEALLRSLSSKMTHPAGADDEEQQQEDNASVNDECAADVWALGCIFAELILLRPLFQVPVGSRSPDHLMTIWKILGSPTRSDCWYLDDPVFDTLYQSGYLGHYEEAHEEDDDPLKRFDTSHSQLQSILFSDPNLKLSPAALDILKGMLRLDPRKRMVAAEVCSHPFFTSLSSTLFQDELDAQEEIPPEVQDVLSGSLDHHKGPVVATRRVHHQPEELWFYPSSDDDEPNQNRLVMLDKRNTKQHALACKCYDCCGRKKSKQKEKEPVAPVAASPPSLLPNPPQSIAKERERMEHRLDDILHVPQSSKLLLNKEGSHRFVSVNGMVDPRLHSSKALLLPKVSSSSSSSDDDDDSVSIDAEELIKEYEKIAKREKNYARSKLFASDISKAARSLRRQQQQDAASPPPLLPSHPSSTASDFDALHRKLKQLKEMTKSKRAQWNKQIQEVEKSQTATLSRSRSRSRSAGRKSDSSPPPPAPPPVSAAKLPTSRKPIKAIIEASQLPPSPWDADEQNYEAEDFPPPSSSSASSFHLLAPSRVVPSSSSSSPSKYDHYLYPSSLVHSNAMPFPSSSISQQHDSSNHTVASNNSSGSNNSNDSLTSAETVIHHSLSRSFDDDTPIPSHHNISALISNLLPSHEELQRISFASLENVQSSRQKQSSQRPSSPSAPFPEAPTVSSFSSLPAASEKSSSHSDIVAIKNELASLKAELQRNHRLSPFPLQEQSSKSQKQQQQPIEENDDDDADDVSLLIDALSAPSSSHLNSIHSMSFVDDNSSNQSSRAATPSPTPLSPLISSISVVDYDAIEEEEDDQLPTPVLLPSSNRFDLDKSVSELSRSFDSYLSLRSSNSNSTSASKPSGSSSSASSHSLSLSKSMNQSSSSGRISELDMMQLKIQDLNQRQQKLRKSWESLHSSVASSRPGPSVGL